MYHYEKDCDKYLLVDDSDGKIIVSLDKIAILFTDVGTLLKHGSEDLVQKYYQDFQKKAPDLAEGLIMFVGDLPVDELNKILSITGYVPLEIRQHHEFLPFGQS